MTQQTHPAPAPTPSSGWTSGGVVFAGVLLLINGVFAILQGISAIATDDVYTRIHNYVYKINLTGWGWILVILGVLGVLAGAALLKGAPGWARGVGIFLAALSMLAQFLFLPYAPLWALVMIGIDFFVIWALAVYRPEHA
ncbi:hypothetical protein AB0D59_00205 [Streptomyces sp. NPDC048417]|uniref:DUF7144 family membrane protein n=1 Tax=Streptomyces sp. NPDC048417 TaxID=3155387 RepID=UPI003420C9B7